MVTSTSLRSRPSTRSSRQSTSPNVLIQDTPTNTPPTSNTNGQHAPTKNTPTNTTSQQTSAGAQEGRGQDTTTTAEDDEADDEADDFAGTAPRRKNNRNMSTTSGAAEHGEDTEMGTAHNTRLADVGKGEAVDEDVAMTDAQDTSALNDLQNYAFSDDGSVADATFNDDDEDGYDAVDDVSEASDDSNAVEKDFERGILAEDMGLGKTTQGIEGIDWDRPETFEMSDWQTGHYGCIDDNGELLTTETYALQQKINTDNRNAEAARLQLTGSRPSSAKRSSGWSTITSSTGSSPRRSVAALSRPNSAPAPDDDDGSDTDDDEDFVRDRVTGGLLSSEDHSEPGGARVSRLMTEGDLPTSSVTQWSPEAMVYPQMRRVVHDTNRPIAYLGENILGGKCLHYQLPARGGWTWLRTEYVNGRVRVCQLPNVDWASPPTPGSGSDSGRDSPTMIDLQAAVTEGNTNTGAPVFDMIQGHLFAATHCPPRFEDSFDLSPRPASSFLHRFTSFDMSFSDVLDQASLNIGGSAVSHHVDDFLHLDACAEPSSSATSPPSEFSSLTESGRPIALPTADWRLPGSPLGPPLVMPNDAPDYVMMDAGDPPFELPGTPPAEAEAPPTSPITPRKRRRSIDSTEDTAFDITSPKKARTHDSTSVTASA